MGTIPTDIHGAADYLDDIIVVGHSTGDLEPKLDPTLTFLEQFSWPQPDHVYDGTRLVSYCIPEAEVVLELKLLKRNKAPGPDFLSSSIFKDAGVRLLSELIKLLQTILETEEVPRDWSPEVYVTTTEASAWCLLRPSYSLTSFYVGSLNPEKVRYAKNQQDSDPVARGGVDHIFTLRRILEHRHSYRQPTAVVFLDLRAAFDSVARNVLWSCLLRKGYCSATTFGQADALFRLIGSRAPKDEGTITAVVNIEADVNLILSEAVRALPVTTVMVKEATKLDAILRQVTDSSIAKTGFALLLSGGTFLYVAASHILPELIQTHSVCAPEGLHTSADPTQSETGDYTLYTLGSTDPIIVYTNPTGTTDSNNAAFFTSTLGPGNEAINAMFRSIRYQLAGRVHGIKENWWRKQGERMQGLQDRRQHRVLRFV
ncbi:uncharacterized protein DEA37_0011130 [Paragonimus westermani]|uniref:Reverse transcriptase domain-containing protein n=1 Tax=Paragonimus westermani TaxID=34504 RepID=A0A5J4NTY5_9TREM|nr:uncharacterized protein DEA37_0011130 [Paragonimus westermani]